MKEHRTKKNMWKNSKKKKLGSKGTLQLPNIDTYFTAAFCCLKTNWCMGMRRRWVNLKYNVQAEMLGKKQKPLHWYSCDLNHYWWHGSIFTEVYLFLLFFFHSLLAPSVKVRYRTVHIESSHTCWHVSTAEQKAEMKVRYMPRSCRANERQQFDTT